MPSSPAHAHDQSSSELRATIRPFTEIIGEWRDEITSLVSSENSETACTACGTKGNISRQLQRYEKALENQVQRVQQLQVMASALEQGATRVLNKAEDYINRVNYRRDLAERAVLSVSSFSVPLCHGKTF